MDARPGGSSSGSSREGRLERRTFLKAVFGATGLVAASSLLAACGSQATPAAPAKTESKPADAKPAAPAAATTAPAAKAGDAKPAASGKPGGRLEMFSWWTTGGEEAGLKAMYAIYEKSHPGVEIVNQAVAGPAGSNAKAVLKTRMQGGDPRTRSRSTWAVS